MTLDIQARERDLSAIFRASDLSLLSWTAVRAGEVSHCNVELIRIDSMRPPRGRPLAESDGNNLVLVTANEWRLCLPIAVASVRASELLLMPQLAPQG